MNTENNLKFQTSCPLPLLKYPVKIRYNEVRKASGFSYILLDLIRVSGGSQEKLTDLLTRFGIPADLHALFGEELASLCRTGIIRSDYENPAVIFKDPRLFSQISVGKIYLTEKGEKMFRDKAIPTGEEKTKTADIYFSPVTGSFDVIEKNRTFPLASSFLGENFKDGIRIDISGMEDYIAANPVKIGLKAEERIVSAVPDDPEWFVIRVEEGMTVTVSKDGAEFSFQTDEENAFLKKYYSADLMTEMLRSKNKYVFRTPDGEAADVPKTEIKKLSGTYRIAGDIGNQVSRPCRLYAARHRVVYGRKDKAPEAEKEIADTTVAGLDPIAEFALFTDTGCSVFSALSVKMPAKPFRDTFEMHLLVEKETERSAFEKAVSGIYTYYAKKRFETTDPRILLYCVQALGNPSMLANYAEEKLAETEGDDKIALLLKMNMQFGSVPIWQENFEKLGNRLLDGSVQDVTLTNMRYKKTVLDPLRDAMKIKPLDFAIHFTENVRNNEDPLLVCQAMEAAGFSQEVILGTFRIVPDLIRRVLDNEQVTAGFSVADNFEIIRINLWKLNEMVGIRSLSDYTLKEDYNTEEFFNAYATLTSAAGKANKYKNYAPNDFQEFDRYLDLLKAIHELLAIERDASSHPDRITKRYIEDLTGRGKYKQAVCDLHVKMQYDLRNILGADQKAKSVDLINEARDKKIITREEANELHAFRNIRNNFQHPESVRQQPPDTKKIAAWEEIVFSLNGRKG